ncbi:MAG: hypothetical protein M1816_001377 [Peltula sp. TS41687]|nr:MAG: hypothetical protein M1816_001377 [Peltula sp. TS41687]
MRLYLLGLLLASLTESRSSSPSAAVYVFDGRRSNQVDGRETPEISPELSRLLISQQLGISQYHSLDAVDDSTISYLNRHRNQEPLLAQAPSDASDVAKLLVFVEGVENAQVIKGIQPSFRMTNIPTPSSNERLAKAFSQQLASREGVQESCTETFEKRDDYFGHVSKPTRVQTGKCCSALPRHMDSVAQRGRSSTVKTIEHEPLRDLGGVLEYSLRQWCGDGTAAVIYISTPARTARTHGTDSAAYKENLASLLLILTKLQELAKTGQQESTVILFPPSSTRNAKRSTDPYGVYSLSARQNQAAEAPLSSSSGSVASSEKEERAKSTLRPAPAPAAQKFLAACHSTHDTCVTATNNCSGHGACTKKYSSHSDTGDKEGGKDCFTCRCSKTNVNKDQTIHWGGNACQKKDVSMPFFLLAGITILIVAAVSSGVGLLFSVGEEPLPGVIGAGVAAGPRVK